MDKKVDVELSAPTRMDEDEKQARVLLGLMGMQGNAIEAQEARGQTAFCASEVLPAELLHAHNQDIMAEVGIILGEQVDGDPIFQHATLPSGWEKRGTDHSMWSKLYDEQGRERARIFYKAAFYDRSAHISFNTRYFVEREWIEDNSEYRRLPATWLVTDRATGEVLHKVIAKASDNEREKYQQDDKASDKASAWLAEHYPDHENEAAYWD